MRTSLVLFSIVIAICTLLYQAHSSTTTLTLPIIAWSPNPSSFPTKENFNTITPEIFESSIRSLIRGGPSSTLFSTSNTEILIVFVEPHLRTDQFSQNSNSDQFKNIKSALLGSASTLFAPYATLANRKNFVDDTFHNLYEEPNVIFVNEKEDSVTAQHGSKTVQLADLSSYLNVNKNIFSNGVAELIVVSFANTEDVFTHDELVGSVLSTLNTHTQNYVAVYTANAPTEDIRLSFPEITQQSVKKGLAISHHASLYESYLELNANNETNCTTPIEVIQHNFFNGPMLEVYLISIILVSIITTGLCCMCELQTPQGFENGKALKFRQL